MRTEHRFLFEGDTENIEVGYIVRTPVGTTVYDSYEPVKWLLINPVLSDRYIIVQFNKPTLTRYMYEEKQWLTFPS